MTRWRGKVSASYLMLLSTGGVIMIYGVLDMSPAMIDPIKGLAKLATVKFTSVFETLLVGKNAPK